MLPNLIFWPDSYHAALHALSWEAAGWRVTRDADEYHVWGPLSIAPHVDRGVLEILGCLDADLD